MKQRKWQARTRDDLIIEVWEALDCESVGAHELVQIQTVLANQLGAGAVISPAAIARVVADEGAVLRHPEVLNSDKSWREDQLATTELHDPPGFANLTDAAASLRQLEELRHSSDTEQQRTELRQFVIHVRADLRIVHRGHIGSSLERALAKEISHWLSVWLENPSLFADWLALRQRSDEYLKMFGDLP